VGTKRIFWFAALAGALFAPHTAAAVDCYWSGWKINYTSPTATMRWVVPRGNTCKMPVRGTRPGYAPVDDLTVVKAPTHGAASVDNSMTERGIAYRASASYRGRDVFIVTGEWHPDFQKGPLRATFLVVVDVVDHL